MLNLSPTMHTRQVRTGWLAYLMFDILEGGKLGTRRKTAVGALSMSGSQHYCYVASTKLPSPPINHAHVSTRLQLVVVIRAMGNNFPVSTKKDFCSNFRMKHQLVDPENLTVDPKTAVLFSPVSEAFISGKTSAGLLFLVESTVVSWLPVASFLFMVVSSANAIYRSNGDPGTVAFIAGSLSILASLYFCMHEFEKAVSQKNTAKRDRLKLAIWLLAMALNTLFSYRVTTVIDSVAFSAVIWGIAAVTTLVGCYLMFFPAKGSE